MRDEPEYRPALWDELERIVGYRITDDNFEGRSLKRSARRSRRKPDPRLNLAGRGDFWDE